MAQQECKEKVRGGGNAWSHCARWKALNYSGARAAPVAGGCLWKGLVSGERDLATDWKLEEMGTYLANGQRDQVRRAFFSRAVGVGSKKRGRVVS